MSKNTGAVAPFIRSAVHVTRRMRSPRLHLSAKNRHARSRLRSLRVASGMRRVCDLGRTRASVRSRLGCHARWWGYYCYIIYRSHARPTSRGTVPFSHSHAGPIICQARCLRTEILLPPATMAVSDVTRQTEDRLGTIAAPKPLVDLAPSFTAPSRPIAPQSPRLPVGF